MNAARWSFLVLMVLAFPWTVAAHPHPYVGLLGDATVLCDVLGLGIDVGGVCIDEGHMPAVPTRIVVVDALVPIVGGVVCMEIDEDGVCGNNGDLMVPFCGSVEIFPVGRIIVTLDGPLGGNPVTSTCGGLTMATVGELFHSPA